MTSGFWHTLKLQISAALLLLLLLFSGAISYTFYAIDQRRNDDVILNLAGKLQLTTQYLAMQAMNYLKNAPRDYATYSRDLRLYYQDLMAHMATFDHSSSAFMSGSFPPELTGLPGPVYLPLDEEAQGAVKDLEDTWADFRQRLTTALGDNPEQPRLEDASQQVVAHHQELEEATNRLFTAYQRLVSRHLEQIALINRVVLVLSLVVSGSILLWFYLHVLRPLGSAVRGFGEVARGDFGHQVTVSVDNEIGWMTDAFNHLSHRLYAIFRLIERIQGGSDLDSTLRFVQEEFNAFLPIDWVGSLFASPDGKSIVLDRAFVDGHAEIGEHKRFALEHTILQQAMSLGEPVHIPDVPGGATQDEHLLFLGELATKGMQSAIFLPLGEQCVVPGVLAFATRRPGAYTVEHLDFLKNIAHLVTPTIGRTVKLVEQARLAAIGEFASGIVHEIRNPLSTIGLALEYLRERDLPEPARKRADLAAGEAARLERLLEDILLYAKPLALEQEPVDLKGALETFLEANRDLPEARSQRFVLQAPEQCPPVMADRDRLTQIFLNLARNACEAAPAGSTIAWSVEHGPGSRTLGLAVHNPGEPIPAQILSRLPQPFFTTKRQGTGLGLSIVQRMVDAHGGELDITSGAEEGTMVRVALPVVGA